MSTSTTIQAVLCSRTALRSPRMRKVDEPRGAPSIDVDMQAENLSAVEVDAMVTRSGHP